MPGFKGIPVSSKSNMQVPVTVVSQPTSAEIEAMSQPPEEPQSGPFPEDIGQAGQVNEKGELIHRPPAQQENDPDALPTDTTPTPDASSVSTSPKYEAVRTGQVKLSDLKQEDFDDFMRSSVVALPKRLPTMLDVRAKDPAYRLRWVNCKADGGRRVDECKAMGFTVATREEVVGIQADSIMIKGAEIKYHDVLLMKVPTHLIHGWLKQNALESMAKVTTKRVHADATAQANKTLRQGISDAGFNYGEVKDLISFYTPGSKEVPDK